MRTGPTSRQSVHESECERHVDGLGPLAGEYRVAVRRWRDDMPFTPFHFGPATLLKALAPQHVSWTAFALSQVVIDLESGYHLLRGDWPVHRLAHSLPVATAIGIVTGTAVWIAGRRLPAPRSVELQAEVQPLPAHAGGFLGGSSHAVLDAIMHADAEPLWPFTLSNPLLGTLDIVPLHVFCLITGACGALVLTGRALRRASGG